MTRLNEYSQSERLAAINIMENFIQKQTEVANSSAPCAPAHSVRDSALPLDAPPSAPEENERSLTMNLEHSVNTTQGNAEKSNQMPLAVTAVQKIEMPVKNCNTVNNYAEKQVEWVRTKDGLTFNIDAQEGVKLTGHRPGLRGFQEIYLDDCAEIHYKKEIASVET
jgi:hypothetical protein